LYEPVKAEASTAAKKKPMDEDSPAFLNSGQAYRKATTVLYDNLYT
jgi:hypothetical protein